MKSEEADLSRAKDLIEVIGKVIAGLLALFYVSGLLMVNAYYNRFGVYSLGLFQLNYIIGGAWVLLPVLLVLLFGAIVFLMYKSLKQFLKSLPLKNDYKSQLRLMKGIALFSLGIGCVGAAGYAQKTMGIILPTFLWFELILSSIMVAGPLSVLGYKFYQRSFKEQPLLIIGLIVITCSFYVAHTFWFARIYGRIPPHVGGGATKDVQLLLALEDKDKEFFELSGLRFYENSNWTQTAKLLFTTDDEYIFQVRPPEWHPESARTLSIKRDLIKSVLYEGLRGGGAGGSYAEEDSNPSPSPSTAPVHTSPSPAGTSPIPSPQP